MAQVDTEETKLVRGTLKSIETAEHTRQLPPNAMVLQVDTVRSCLGCPCSRRLQHNHRCALRVCLAGRTPEIVTFSGGALQSHGVQAPQQEAYDASSHW